MGTVIIIVILGILVFFAVKESMKHMKGEGGCCGGSGPSKKPRKKKLDGEIIETKKILIDGMHCDHCRDSVQNALNEIEGLSAQVNLKQNCAIVRSTRKISDEELICAVEEVGFEIKSIENA